MRRSPAAVLLLAGAALAGACTNPTHELDQTQRIMELGTEINNLHFYIEALEGRIDSLRGALASADTAINRIATFSGIVLPGRQP